VRHSYRLQVLLLPAATVIVAAAAALGAARGGTALLAVGAVAAVVGFAVVLSLRPDHVFLAWLAVAPFVQGTIGSSGATHFFRVLVYSTPPLIFVLWTFTEHRPLRLTFVDALPTVYFVIVLLTAQLGPGNPSPTQVYSTVGVGVIVYYLCAFGPIGDDVLPRVAGVLLVTGSISAGWVLVARAFGYGSSAYQLDVSASAERAAGTFGAPAVFGTFLGVVLAVALSVLAWGWPRRLRRLSIPAIALAIPALFLSLTRGPLIGAGVVALLILVLRGRTRWRTVLAVAIALVVLVAAWGAISSTHLYKSRFSNSTDVQIRVVIDRLSLKLAEEKPILGWGYGSFDTVKDLVSFNPAPFTRSEVLYYTSHNTFLTVLAETGIVGLALLVLPWLVLARRSLIAAARPLVRQRWALVALLGMLGVWIVSAGTFDTRFFSLVSALPFLAAGLMRRLELDRQTGSA
jgi:O-antigen ligase